jgi:hypothetical protein
VKPYVLSIDPGLTTGVVLVNTQTLEMLYAGELDWKQTGEYVEKTLEEYSAADLAIVAERFTINARTHKNSQAPYSLMVLGMIDWIVLKADGSPVQLQTPANAKSQADNACLKRLGLWYKGGEGHALDAIRHVVHYMIRSGWKDRRLLPSDEEE